MDPVEPKVYKEGLLFKRQRGLHQSSTKKLKFQERFIRLTSTSLDYYVPNPRKRTDGPKGQFAVEQLRIVEVLPPNIFGKEYPHLFQIGDNVEIMYFAARTSQDRDEWLEACRRASREWGNKMLSHYHKGVYGLVNKGRWSCCANPTRACSGCSPVTPGEDLTKSYAGGSRSLPPDAKEHAFSTTLPAPIACNPSPISTSSGVSFPEEMSDSISSNVSIKTLTKSTTLTDTTDESTAPPLIRSFTLADPVNVVHRPDPKRIQELRNSKRLTQDLEEAELEVKKEAEKREGEEGQKKKILVEDFKDKNNDLGELSKIAQELQGDVGESHKENNRSGASSPSPSIDSGKGGSSGTGSRPNSQVINLEENSMRAIRSESVGKKSTQSTQSDQGVVADEGISPKGHLQKQTTVEEPDGPQQPSSSPTPHSISADDSKEKDDREREEKDNKEDTSETEKEGKEKDDEMKKKREIIQARRKMSSPVERTPTPDNSKPKPRPMSEMSSSGSIDNLKAMIGNRSSLYSSGSDMSGPITPQHRKYISSSPRIGERPRSTLLRGLSIITDQDTSSYGYGMQYNRLHRACEDGNLEVLEEELNEKLNEEGLDLNEPSYTPVPYTPLFIAFMNDHYQTMVCLLSHGANPNCTEPQSKASVLHWACEKDCVDVVELLIQYNADVNMKDNHGNTPLMEACKHGHLDIVKILLQNGALVDQEGRNKRTSLHEASEAGHSTIAEVLIKEGADPIPHDGTNSTPYDLAFHKGHKKVMMVLQQLIPESVRPYSFISSHTIPSSQMITTLAFKGTDVLISGSRDCHACFWDTSDLSVMRCVRVTNTVLRVDLQGGFLAIGSTNIQLVDTNNMDKRRTVADDTVSDESLQNPPLHLVAFGPKGRLVTAAVESNIVKLWPPVSPHSSIVTTPESSITVKHEQNVKEPGCVYSLSVSPSLNSPWLAVGLQPGKMFQPTGNKLIYLYNWETRERRHIFDAGDGGLAVSVHTTFSPDGHHLAIGCSENLCIWDAQSGNLLYKLTMPDGVYISSVSYSPDAAHLAAGLSTGEVEVFEMSSSSSIFTLSKPETPSPATSLAYTEDGKLFAVGHQNGVLQLWEGRQSWVSTL